VAKSCTLKAKKLKKDKLSTGKFKVYRASAGSGKTFTLTKEYLKLAIFCPKNYEENPKNAFNAHYFKHILAVTFTNDAANQMKSRILGALNEIIDFKGEGTQFMAEAILNEIQVEYGVKLTLTEIKKRAKAIQHCILHNYSDFSVSTIDAFNKKIVQSFSKDLDLPLNFEVTLDRGEVVEEAIGQILQNVGKDGDVNISDILRNFAITRVQNNQKWEVIKDLKSFAVSNMFDEEKFKIIEELRQIPEEEFLKIYDRYKNHFDYLKSDLQDSAKNILDVIHQYGFKSEDFSYGDVYKYFVKIMNAENVDKILEPANNRLLTQADKQNFLSAKNKNKELEEFNQHLVVMFEKFEKKKESCTLELTIAGESLKFFFELASMGTLQNTVDSINNDKKQVLISDFNKKINKVILSEPIPYIYERIGEYFKHILIDEFQDTSRTQWVNLIPLIANSLTENQTCMLVGDAKQSIYRFRGGNPQLMVDLPHLPFINDILEEHQEVFKYQFQDLTLDTNRRSYENIIHFNNDLFEKIITDLAVKYPDLANYYQDVIQKVAKPNHGHVEIKLIDEDEAKISNSTYEAETLQEIHRLIEKVTTEFHYDYQDIAILVDKNKQGSLIANYLIERDIPVISSDSLLINSSPVVRFIINIFKILVESKSPETKFEMIDFLVRKYHPKRVYSGLNYFHISSVCNQKSNQPLIKLIKEITDKDLYLRGLTYQTVYEIAEEIVRVFDLQELKGQQIYLQKFFDVLMSEGKKRKQSVSDFLEFWEFKKTLLSISGVSGAKAVRIVTIHKSKGLEFKVVIMPFAEWKLTPKSAKIWIYQEDNPIVPEFKPLILNYKRDHILANDERFEKYFIDEEKSTLIDQLNKLYVALTRAEERMYIISKAAKKDSTSISFRDVKNCAEIFQNYTTICDKKNGDTHVIYEDNLHNIHAKQKPDEALFDIDFITTNHRERIKMRKNNLKSMDSRLHAEDFFDTAKISRFAASALDRLMYIDDVSLVIEQMEEQGLCSTSEAAELLPFVYDLITMESVKPYFVKKTGRKVFLDKEIISKQNAEPIAVSRLVVDAKNAVLIEYRAGKFSKDDANKIKKATKALKMMAYELTACYFIDTLSKEIITI